MGILWTIIIGFIAGVIAKFLMPGPNEPSGFILTAILASWADRRHLPRSGCGVVPRGRAWTDRRGGGGCHCCGDLGRDARRRTSTY